MIEPRLILDLLVILAAGFAAGATSKKLGLSMLVGYLLVGTLIGSRVLGLVSDHSFEVEELAHLGVLFLLFSVGLEFSLEELTKMSRTLLVGGGSYVLLVTVFASLFLVLIGMDPRVAFLLGAAASLSSTVVVYKVLSEWGQTTTRTGKSAIGILLFQDVSLVPFLLLIPLLTGEGDLSVIRELFGVALTSTLLVVGVVVLRSVVRAWIIPGLVLLRSPELVVLFSIVVLSGMAFLAYLLNLPAVLGAFAAGLVLSDNRLTSQIDALVLPFRETFAAVFFVSLGLLLDPRIFITEMFVMVPILIGLVLLKWGAGGISMRLTGLPWRASLGMGAGLAHLGEFSFVVVLEAVHSGLLAQEDYQRFLALAIGTLIITPQMIRRGLSWTYTGTDMKSDTRNLQRIPLEGGRSAVIIGLGPIGKRVFSKLEVEGYEISLVDLSPVNLHPFAVQGFQTISGNASDPDVLSRAGADRSHFVVVSVPDDASAIQIVRSIRGLNSNCTILARVRYLANTGLIKKAGANFVVTDEGETSAAILRVLSSVEEAPD